MITFVTGSERKFLECESLLNTECVHLRADLEEIQGSAEEIVIDKARRALRLARTLQNPNPVLVDDVSFHIDALGGFPGPYAKWFHQDVSPQEIFNMIEKTDVFWADAVCLLGYASSPSDITVIEGRCHGCLVPPRKEAYGFDGIFIPTNVFGRVLRGESDVVPWQRILQLERKTFSEMAPERKYATSHRGAAIETLNRLFTR